jgi:hypothetical protein
MRVMIACALFVVTGCLGDAGDDAPPAELVGTWRYLPKQSIGDVPEAERQVVTFAADGSYEIRAIDDVESGHFVAHGRDLTIDPGGDHWITTNYLATADRLLVDAMFPVGAVDGTAGVWRGAQSADAGSATVTLTFDPDGGGRLEQTGPATTDVDGTWTHVGDDVVFTYLSRSGTPVPKRYQEVPGVAVGEWLYERID